MRSGIDCKGTYWEERPLGKLINLTGCRFTKLIVYDILFFVRRNTIKWKIRYIIQGCFH